MRCERVRESNDSQYEQFHRVISPEMTEQELMSVDCAQQQTDLRKFII